MIYDGSVCWSCHLNQQCPAWRAGHTNMIKIMAQPNHHTNKNWYEVIKGQLRPFKHHQHLDQLNPTTNIRCFQIPVAGTFLHPRVFLDLLCSMKGWPKSNWCSDLGNNSPPAHTFHNLLGTFVTRQVLWLCTALPHYLTAMTRHNIPLSQYPSSNAVYGKGRRRDADSIPCMIFHCSKQSWPTLYIVKAT